MIYFFDFEFEERPAQRAIQPISIGVVAEDGREFYGVFEDYYAPDDVAHQWLRENVLPRLQPARAPIFARCSAADIREGLASFVGDDPEVEFVGYYASYDWVLLCQLMGGMLALPKGWRWLPRDLRTELDRRLRPEIKDEGRADEHNALADARWIRDAWREMERPPR